MFKIQFGAKALICSALILSFGCSTVYVKGPAPRAYWDYKKATKMADCTESYAIPMVEALVIPQLVTGFFMGVARTPGDLAIGGGISLLASGALMVDAIMGAEKIAQCRRYNEMVLHRLSRR